MLPHGLYRWTAHANDFLAVSAFMPDRYFGFGPQPTFTKTTTPGKTSGTNRGEMAYYRLTTVNPSNSPLTITSIVDTFGPALSGAGAVVTWGGTGVGLPNRPRRTAASRTTR